MDKPSMKDIMKDGSRHFATLPQKILWDGVKDHVSKLDGARLTAFICDNVTEAWIDFTYQGHEFSINDQYGEYWFFVKDPKCPDATLQKVSRHFESLLKADDKSL